MKAISPAALQEERYTWPFLWSIWKSEHSISCHCQFLKIGFSPPWDLAAESAMTLQSPCTLGLRPRVGAGFFKSKRNLNALTTDGKRKWKYIPLAIRALRGHCIGVACSHWRAVRANNSNHTQIIQRQFIYLFSLSKRQCITNKSQTILFL